VNRKLWSSIVSLTILSGMLALLVDIQSYSTTAQANILTHSGWIDSIGYYHISGEAENVGDSALKFVKITATFYDSSESVVATSFTYTSLKVLLPGRKSPFEVLLVYTTQAAKVHHYSLSTEYSITSPIPTSLEILSHNSFVDIINYKHVVGEVRNIAGSTATYVKVAVTFYDSAGHVVATSFTFSSPSDIDAGQKAPFEVLLVYTNRVALIDSYSLTVESDQFALVPEFSSFLIPSLFIIATLLAVTICKRKHFT